MYKLIFFPSCISPSHMTTYHSPTSISTYFLSHCHTSVIAVPICRCPRPSFLSITWNSGRCHPLLVPLSFYLFSWNWLMGSKISCCVLFCLTYYNWLFVILRYVLLLNVYLWCNYFVSFELYIKKIYFFS